MDGDVLICAENVSKKFCRRLKRSLWYGVQDLASEAVGRPRSGRLRKEEFWAVKDVSFEVRRGEALGLIGRNGAGKSTLLKLLNGLILPDRGGISTRGRVGALIELGAGFNPILTGRENILVNASILGIPRREVEEKLDAIVAFAEIGDFIDTPVQNYSSGMLVRLGFSVAINMRPDILLIDEVLAVGDIGFRNKCLDKIQEIRQSGVAIIFVSHNLGQVDRLCDSAICLRLGEVLAHGRTGDVIAAYVSDTMEDESGYLHHPGTEEHMRVRDVQLLTEDGQPADRVVAGAPLTIRMEFEAKRTLEAPIFNFMIEPLDRQIVAAFMYQDRHVERPSFSPGIHAVSVSVKRFPVLPGRYHLRVTVVNPNNLILYGRISNLARISVVPRENQWIVSNQSGLTELEGEWRVWSHIDAAPAQANTAQ